VILLFVAGALTLLIVGSGREGMGGGIVERLVLEATICGDGTDFEDFVGPSLCVVELFVSPGKRAELPRFMIEAGVTGMMFGDIDDDRESSEELEVADENDEDLSNVCGVEKPPIGGKGGAGGAGGGIETSISIGEGVE